MQRGKEERATKEKVDEWNHETRPLASHMEVGAKIFVEQQFIHYTWASIYESKLSYIEPKGPIYL